MANYVKYYLGTLALDAAVNAATDTWKIALSNTAPNVATDTTLLSATELATGGGYTAGGVTLTSTSHTQTTGVVKTVLTAPNPTWTASGAGFTFRYVLLYNFTITQLIGYWDYGVSQALNGTNGDILTPTLDQTNGTYTIT